MIHADALELWVDLEKKKDEISRDIIVKYYYPWLKKVSFSLHKKYFHELLDYDDILSLSSVALIEGIEKYRLNRKVPFKAFVYPRIKGKILNEIRRLNKGRSFNTGFGACNIGAESSIGAFSDIADIVEYTIFSFYTHVLENSSNNDTVYNEYSNSELTKKVLAIVEMLPQNEKYVIESFYFERLKMYEIAIQLSITTSRVSQIHKNAIYRIKTIFSEIF